MPHESSIKEKSRMLLLVIQPCWLTHLTYILLIYTIFFLNLQSKLNNQEIYLVYLGHSSELP